LLAGCVPHPVYRSSPQASPPVPRSAPTAPETEAAPSGPVPKKEVVVAPPAEPPAFQPVDTSEVYQVGMASYYGEKFHGQPTASGELFNMYKFSAAHRVLPLGTFIRVTNLENGRRVEVKVNDRGPFVEGRILDLSFAAALELEMVKAGTARVMIEVVKAMEP
jgi:rare lipoprotein A